MKVLNYLKFTPSDLSNFPKEHCLEKTDEKNVFESNQQYWCLCEEPFHYEIKKAKPYIYKTEGKILYGWSGKHILNNKINGVFGNAHYYDKVIAFAPETHNIEQLFIKSSKENFPTDKCVKYDKEEDIYKSDEIYTCLIIDKRFKDEYLIKEMCPYIQKEKDKIYMAWLDTKGDFIDNFENSVHGNCWDQYVIGYIKKAE